MPVWTKRIFPSVVTYGPTLPSSPVVDQVHVNTSATPWTKSKWNGSAWVADTSEALDKEYEEALQDSIIADQNDLAAHKTGGDHDTRYVNEVDHTKAAHDALAITPGAHSHAGEDITAGTVSVSRIGTGTKDTTTFYRGDGTFAVPPAGGGGGG